MNKNKIHFNGDDNLHIYLNYIRKTKPITKEEEIKYYKLAKSGDKSAYNKLIESNLRLVVLLAKKYAVPGISISDLISEGNIGLIKSIDKFDDTIGVRFISYAYFWIKQSILDFLYKNKRTIRLPNNIIQEYSNLKKNSGFLANSEIELILNDDVKELPDCLSLNDLKYDNFEHIQNISDDYDFVDDLTNKENDKDINNELFKILDVLSDRERMIIELYYGINGNTPMSLTDIGNKLSLTPERIRQIKKNAIRKLRNSSYKLFILYKSKK